MLCPAEVFERVDADLPADNLLLSVLDSLCNSGAEVKDENLEVCGAVVLHELQRLSWSTVRGSILSEDIINAHLSSSDPDEIR